MIWEAVVGTNMSTEPTPDWMWTRMCAPLCALMTFPIQTVQTVISPFSTPTNATWAVLTTPQTYLRVQSQKIFTSRHVIEMRKYLIRLINQKLFCSCCCEWHFPKCHVPSVNNKPWSKRGLHLQRIEWIYIYNWHMFFNVSLAYSIFTCMSILYSV